MSAVLTPSLRRDLGLVGWQIRYEQRAYWRNRGRGIFTFVFPIMFLVIFASLDKGAHISSLGGIPYDDFFVPGILAYGVIATTFVNMAIGTAILRDEGVLKRMQGTPLPRWAYVAARIGSTIVIVGLMTVLVLALGVTAYGRARPRGDAARPDRHAGARHGGVHDARDRHHAVHPQRRGGAGDRQPDGAAARRSSRASGSRPTGCRPCSTTSPSCSRSGRWPTACSTRSTRAPPGPDLARRTCARC